MKSEGCTPDNFLWPFLWFSIQDDPAIYFFQKFVRLENGTKIREVEYIGQTSNAFTRIGSNNHHAMARDGCPDEVSYLSLPGATKEGLDAAENAFMFLFRPRNNRRWVYPGVGEEICWVKTLVELISDDRHAVFYRWLVEKEFEHPQGGQRVWELMMKELETHLSAEDQIRICREFVFR